MRQELTIEQQQAALKMFRELVGFTVAEAKAIIKDLLSKLDEHAVVEEAN